MIIAVAMQEAVTGKEAEFTFKRMSEFGGLRFDLVDRNENIAEFVALIGIFEADDIGGVVDMPVLVVNPVDFGIID
jgi:hypothetical protein